MVLLAAAAAAVLPEVPVFDESSADLGAELARGCTPGVGLVLSLAYDGVVNRDFASTVQLFQSLATRRNVYLVICSKCSTESLIGPSVDFIRGVLREARPLYYGGFFEEGKEDTVANSTLKAPSRVTFTLALPGRKKPGLWPCCGRGLSTFRMANGPPGDAVTLREAACRGVAAAAVRCTNFVAEAFIQRQLQEQPTVHLVGNASRLLTDATLHLFPRAFDRRVACAAEEARARLPCGEWH
ncbi:hypothetical protein AK812_SmicGene24920 [Symbiodinium microadriaticum]|uniref:Uncharacterized protein n=1 Tax=Symbiodinium microadriaticum TaxID=2951 RepID=A0A1Q9DD97_SYMMI|nr:hypothetical protein AK812_SmicGene24920 [Symbiodinium microadriaticum]